MRMQITVRRTTYEYATVDIDVPFAPVYDLDAIANSAAALGEEDLLEWSERDATAHIDPIQIKYNGSTIYEKD